MSPLMLPAILTGLALFQFYLLAGIGRPVWGLSWRTRWSPCPMCMRTTLAVLHNFDRRIEEAAAVLGASPARVFFEVTLPLIRPGVIAGGIFAFIVSFDQFPVSLFLVVPEGRDPAGRAVQLHEVRPRRRHRRRLDGLDPARARRWCWLLERLIGLQRLR